MFLVQKGDIDSAEFDRLHLTGDSDEEMADGALRRSDSDEDDGELTVRSGTKGSQPQSSALGPLIGSRTPFYAWSDDDDRESARRNDNQAKRTSRYVPRNDDEDELETRMQHSFDDIVQRTQDDAQDDKNTESQSQATDSAPSAPSEESWADFSAFDSALAHSAASGAAAHHDDDAPITFTVASSAARYAVASDANNESES